MAPFVALAAIVLLASSRLVAGSRAGVILRPTGVPAWPPARRSSRCRNLLARERTPIGDTARQLSQKPVELADKLHLEVGFNRPALLNVLVPLNPRHFSDAVNEDLASARARCPDCTCGYSEQRGGYSLCNSARERRNAQKGWLSRCATTLYFALWYLLSIGHSVTGKQLTNALPLPWSVAAAQIVVGALFALCLWLTGLRAPPTGTLGGMARDLPMLARFLPIGAFHAIGHIAGIVGTSRGSVSFAQVVKSAGPIYACVLSSLVLKQAVSLRVWASLLPILGGVALATTSELTLAWAALFGAVISDVALALRNIYCKVSMEKREGSNLSAANTFALTTCLAALFCVPLAAAAEGQFALATWRAAAPTAAAGRRLTSQIVLTGLYFYGYSEVAMKALKNVHPVTHAIGNTMRRVVIMLICIAVFHTPMSAAGAVGSAIAIGGSYFYAMVKTEEKEVAEATAKADAAATDAAAADAAQAIFDAKFSGAPAAERPQ